MTAQVPTTTLVVLSYDEHDALEKLLPMMPLQLFDRVLAVDPGSRDGTLDLYRQHHIECAIQARRGRGNAFILAQERVATDQVVFFSADGNEDPRDLPRMLQHLREGYDMVVAGRYVLDGAQTDMSDDPLALRKLGGIACGLLVRLIWRAAVWDAINGFRGFQVSSMQRMRLDAAGHDIEFHSTIRAAKLGMKVHEFPTRELPRLGGQHKPTASTWRLGWAMLRCLLRELRIGMRFAP
jgi:glycosyltransferase involved in cell wall biosynthesis